MSEFEDLGVMIDGLDDGLAEEYEGDIEEIFRFDVSITPRQEIEIGINVKELMVEGFPEFGEEYSMLAHIYAKLITEHVGMSTEKLIDSVNNLTAGNVELSEEEERILADKDSSKSEAVLLYTFPVMIMNGDEDSVDEKQLGVGFSRSPKADVMLKVYGQEYANAEDNYQESITDAILDHGMLFIKAVEAIQKL